MLTKAPLHDKLFANVNICICKCFQNYLSSHKLYMIANISASFNIPVGDVGTHGEPWRYDSAPNFANERRELFICLLGA